MVYRDDDVAMLRSEVESMKKRLDKFEALYEKEGIKRRKSMIANFFGGLWDLVTAPFHFVWEYKFAIFIVLLVAGGIGGLGTLIVNQNADQAARAEQEEQALYDQCSSFCETHGYHFYEDRQDNLCFCGTDDSEDTAFIINVDTSQNWTVGPNNGE